MGAFDKLQRAADARRGDERALASLADCITNATRRYKAEPTRANYRAIEDAVTQLRRAEQHYQDEG